MLDFLIRRKWSKREIDRALVKATEFRRNRYTSGSAHLDDLITLHKAVILCEAHARRFNERAARYTRHPDRKMHRVIGNCDVCNEMGLSHLFVSERDAVGERKKVEAFRRAIEYATLLRS